MTKAPRAGHVKTRLCPPLSPGEAAELATRFLQDTLGHAAGSGAALLVAYAPPDARDELASSAPEGVRWLAQAGEDLGQRQEHALRAAADLGYAPLVVIGTDSPTLGPGPLSAAFSYLEDGAAEVVLGPTLDGGYCLLGVRRPVPGLLDGIAWSTASVCQQVQENAAALGLRVATLAPWYDVDTPEDLRRLWQDLHRSPIASAQAPATYRWMKSRSAGHPPG